tara:strand:- start:580 stop:693 length:114 start_codon:yes stop_codon:yes gene_type:complete
MDKYFKNNEELCIALTGKTLEEIKKELIPNKKNGEQI